MKTTIIMPSIRVPQNLKAWADLLDPYAGDEVIIAGNVASPHSDILDHAAAVTKKTGVLIDYVHPDDGALKEYSIYQFTLPNHTVRRNFALLRALTRRPDVLVSLDDDNFPVSTDWLRGVQLMLSPDYKCMRPIVHSDTGWWNAGELLRPPAIHRGFPLTRWNERPATTIANTPNSDVHVSVVASLWLGDPDINAVERIMLNPEIHEVNSAILALGTWCPFDSQSTAVAGDLAEMMFMWPDVGRYDDIWSSYLMRACMDVLGRYITYGKPAVRQARNPHNLVRDLRDELHGYEHTETYTNVLRKLVAEAQSEVAPLSPYELFYAFQTQVAYLGSGSSWLPDYTRDALLAWLQDTDMVRQEN